MTIGDILVAAVLAGLTGFLIAWQWADSSPGGAVEIHVENRLWGQYPLHTDRNVSVPGNIGESQLEIQDAQVRFLSSPCRNKVCLHSGWQSRAGQATACLPNRISILVTGEEESDAPGPQNDAITY